MIGLHATFGVAVAYGLIQLFIHARSVLILIGLAFFIAAGLDPIVGWLVRHGVPRWAAVVVVIVGGDAIVAGVLAAAIPPMASEATSLAHQIPHYIQDLQDKNSQLGKLNVKYHVQDRLTKLLTSEIIDQGPGDRRVEITIAVLSIEEEEEFTRSSCSPTG